MEERGKNAKKMEIKENEGSRKSWKWNFKGTNEDLKGEGQ